MKQGKLTYRILAFGLAMLMFITSSGIVIDMHFCGGTLKSIGIFTKAKTCVSENGCQKMMACSTSLPKNDKYECTINKKECCQNKTFVIQNGNSQNQHQATTDTSNLLVLYIESFLLTQNSNRLNEDISSFNIYRPPLVTKDIQILYQSFLI